jgi:hypothetical protein
MPDTERIETDWQTLVAAKAAYSVGLFDKGLSRVFAYQGRRYTTTTVAYSTVNHDQEAWLYEIVSLADYHGDVPVSRTEPLRKHAYPGLIVKVENTEEEVVVTDRRLFLRSQEPEDERQANLKVFLQSGNAGSKKNGAALPGQLTLL